jgi:hypothetical protein
VDDVDLAAYDQLLVGEGGPAAALGLGVGHE